VRAAYNFYQAHPGRTNSQALIGAVTFEGIFEIGPVDGQTALTLNALGTAWNVLLPMCDGDVSNLQGVKTFDRVLRVNSESPARQKSSFCGVHASPLASARRRRAYRSCGANDLDPRPHRCGE